MAAVQKNQSNRLLGYPDDARLLIINADDFGMCHSINEAILHSLKDGIVRSTSLMMPCPWARHALCLLRENPDIPFGVHLTLVAEHTDYGWGPLTCREKVPSLVGERGWFYHLSHMADMVAQANIKEVEIEFRAQIEAVLAAGLKPTQLDWHCLHDGGSEAIFNLTVGLAKEYGLALRVSGPAHIERLQSQELPTNEYPLLNSYEMDIPTKAAQYQQRLRELPAGLSEWAIHPGTGAGELQALEPNGWRVRQSDYEFAMSPEAQDIIQREGIILLDYQPLRKLWQHQ
jgi:chitin disaccharide deacetylase